MTRQPYPSDLTDRQWRRLEPLIPAAKPGGRPRSAEMREVVDAIVYVLRNGVVWRALPHDFPPWKTVYRYFRQWRRDGTWAAIHDALREQVRVAAGREAEPSAAILDSQSVKTTERGGRAATTRGSRSTAANATFSSIRWDCSWRSWSIRPTSRRATGRSWCCAASSTT